MVLPFRVYVLRAVTINNSVFVEVTSSILRFNNGCKGSRFLRKVGEYFVYHSIVCVKLSFEGNNKSGTEGTVKEKTSKEYSNQDERS